MSGLPRGWTTALLGDLCLPVAKQDPAQVGRQRIRYLDIGAVDGGTHRHGDVAEIVAATAPSRARQVLADGDTVFSTVRPYLEKIAFVGPELDGEFASTGFCVLRPGSGLDPRYLFHYATSPALLDQVLPHQRGVSYPAVLNKDVLAATIPLPPLEEQQRIVTILEGHLSRLDAAERCLATARVRLLSLDAATGVDSMRSFESADGKAVRFGDSRLVVPKTWEVTTVGQVAYQVQYGTSAKTREKTRNDDVPVLRMGNIKEGQISWDSLKYLSPSDDRLREMTLETGDLLFNRTNSTEHVGKTAVFAGAGQRVSFASYLIRVRLENTVNPHWAALVINSPYGRSHIASVVSQQVGQANVNGTKLKAFPLVLPPRDVQDALVARYVAVVDESRRLVRHLDGAQHRAGRLRTALLQAAFSGRLTGDEVLPAEAESALV